MKTLIIVYFALVLITLSACQPSGKDAIVPGNNACITDPASCGTNGAVNGSAYQQNQGYSPYGNPYGGSSPYGSNPYGGNPYGGSSPYGSNPYGGNPYGGSSPYGSNPYGSGYNQPFNYYNNNAYLCNCPNGSIPTYNGTSGIGCVARTNMSATVGLSGFFYLSWGNNQWNTLPQLYQYNYGGGNTSCYNGAVQSCTVGQVNSCPSGYLCQLSISSSSLGLCVVSHR